MNVPLFSHSVPQYMCSESYYTPAVDPENMEKLLQDFEITNGTRLKCDDFLQEYSIVVTIAHA